MSCPCLSGDEEKDRAGQYEVPDGVPGQESMGSRAASDGGMFGGMAGMLAGAGEMAGLMAMA